MPDRQVRHKTNYGNKKEEGGGGAGGREGVVNRTGKTSARRSKRGQPHWCRSTCQSQRVTAEPPPDPSTRLLLVAGPPDVGRFGAGCHLRPCRPRTEALTGRSFGRELAGGGR